MRKLLIVLGFIAIFSCKKENNESITARTQNTEKHLFTQIDSKTSNIHFKNSIQETLAFNFLNYAYIFIGGGVATGDINNDGLIDIYFTSNQHENKLYLNKGNFVFEDITKKANITDTKGWTAGVTMVDINNDGWLDIYVCKSASLKNDALRKNKLYINQKNGTFKEEAERWKLDDNAFSIQAYFFDMDKDGDLDMYLVNHRDDFKNNTKISIEIQKNTSPKTSDKLYRNDGTYFTDISKKAGITNKSWGLSAAIGDFNNDGWPDVYVCNDYLEPDNLYINNKNGTFTDEILTKTKHISFSSMGSDFADFNNDLKPDLAVLDMTPADHIRSKKNMASMSTKNFNAMVQRGYHHQYMANMLQLNNGNGSFSEIAQLAGVSKTDWSWAPLFADFDNDGLKDLYITNGIVKDMGNRDFRIALKNKNKRGEALTLKALEDMIPEEKITNYFFKNNGDLTFKNVSKKWTDGKPSYSNGAAYADLDNDGDLDLIVNNMNDKAFIFKNNSKNNYLKIHLKGTPKNVLAIGTKVYAYSKNKQQVQTLYLSRGYQSSVTNSIHFGFGNETLIDSIKVVWPDNKTAILKNQSTNQTLTIDYKNAKNKTFRSKKSKTFLTTNQLDLKYKHKENTFYDFTEQILLPYSQSHNGPFIEKADVNNDGLEDFFIGGAANQSGTLFIQQKNGGFKQKTNPFSKDKAYEDLGIVFFDYDNDNDLDLYVVSGGSEFKVGSNMFQDRLYQNDGHGNFTKTQNVLPKIVQSGQTVIANDIDNDGDMDLFIGGRLIPNKYPYPPTSYFLINNNGKFTKSNKGLENLGMVTAAVFTDYDNDGDKDLMVVGEWSKIHVLKNTDGQFTSTSIKSLQNSLGIWFSITAHDIDDDGDEDFIIGNLGKNTKFNTEKGKEFHIFCDDFDNNGTYDIVLSNKYKGRLVPSRGRECSSQQVPSIQKKFPTYTFFANATVKDMFGDEKLANALHYKANTLYSVYLENIGDGTFKMTNLPNQAQFSPITAVTFKDINHNGKQEIITIGNLFNTEVETVRYDASIGSILDYTNGNFSVLNASKTGFQTTGDAKDLLILNHHIIVTNNDGKLDVFTLE